MSTFRCPSVCLAFLAGVWTTWAAAAEPLFPFVVSYDSPENVTNMAQWLPRPAGNEGFVRASGGQLVAGAEGQAKPIRFWATNLCFDACFPAHEEAQRLAARLARLGINCVRLHHMDNHSIWGNSPNKTIIDPKRLDRLDDLIYQLKLQGIYVDINLHVSRWFDKAEGFGAREERPNYDKGLDNFEPRMIELQKKYARDLLTHVNPYTKTAYVDEPAVAFVEINNENSLWSEWGWNGLDKLPEPYAGTFRGLWNRWLKKKYGDTAALRRAWNAHEEPLGKELLTNGDFAKPLPGAWFLETDDQTKAEWSVAQGGPAARQHLRLAVTRLGRVAWRPQLVQSGFAVKKDKAYTLSFQIRADHKAQISVNCMMAHDPWQRLGFDMPLAVGPLWQEVRRTFVVDRDDDNARLTLSGFQQGVYELAAVSLRPGGILGLPKEQTLEAGNVPVLRHSERGMTREASSDFVDFLWDTERDYWWGMYRFLKDDLKVRQVILGTQLGWSPVHIQAGLDSIDAHAYWNHPHFPGRPWDPANWTVRNVALVNTPGGTLSEMASRRVAGMPFTVSEYNHPEPNQYAAEGLPMIAAFAAFQGWDGVFSFAYSHDPNFSPRRIASFFDIKSVTPRLVHMPACAAMFLRGDVAKARQTRLAPLSLDDERENLRSALNAWQLTTGRFGVDPLHSLQSRIALEIGKGEKPPAGKSEKTSSPDLKGKTSFVSDTGQIRWDASQKGAGIFIVDSPRTKLFTGFVRERTFDLGSIRLKVGKTRLDWATVSLVAIDGSGFDQPGRILVAATGVVQNSAAILKKLDGENITLGNRWGTDPVLCEGIPAEITLPVTAGRVKFYPLDEAGNRRGPIEVEGDQGTVLRLSPEHKTVWYEVEVR